MGYAHRAIDEVNAIRIWRPARWKQKTRASGSKLNCVVI